MLHGAPEIQRDSEDEKRDRQADERGKPRAERNRERAGDDAERHEPVCAGMVAVGNEGSIVEAPPRPQVHLSGELVADEADQRGGRERPQVREDLLVNQANNVLVGGDAGGDEDGEDDRDPGPAARRVRYSDPQRRRKQSAARFTPK